MHPKSITTFQILSWISIGISGLGLLILMVIAGNAGPFAGSILSVLLIPLAIVAALAVLTYLAGQKRSNVARWIYVALAGLLILLTVVGLFGGRTNAISVILALLQCGLLGGAITFLMMPESSAWFAQGHPYGGYGGGYPPNPGHPHQHGNWGGQQGGGYPPQQGGNYPPQQGGGYPPQQGGGYPPQQSGGHPPQQGGGYPPQQSGGHPPQQGGGYPPQGGDYPPNR